jgi:hypothetical protein
VSEQPEALRLADVLSSLAVGAEPRWVILEKSAAELRRQHAVNAELLEALKVVAWTLNLVHPYGVPDVLHEGSAFRKNIIAAISKAEGVKPPRIEGYNTNRDQPTFTIKEVKP